MSKPCLSCMAQHCGCAVQAQSSTTLSANEGRPSWSTPLWSTPEAHGYQLIKHLIMTQDEPCSLQQAHMTRQHLQEADTYGAQDCLLPV